MGLSTLFTSLITLETHPAPRYALRYDMIDEGTEETRKQRTHPIGPSFLRHWGRSEGMGIVRLLITGFMNELW